jgi:Zn-dependent protease with chaperone function
MDFFERQDKARKNTKALVLYFFVAVVLIIAAVYLACLLIFAGVSAKAHRQGQGPQIVLWNPEILLWAAGGALTVIICGSVYKLAALSGGGKTVAESLGGRPVQPNTTDLNERKLLNVVEEMALASGVPVPQVYVLDQEQGINAFAAGYTPSDAVIGVTRGAIQTLTRDELQGVIAHEFSHILNGDMRLNIRLIGIIFGILCLAIIGRILIRTRGRKNPLPLLGLALIIIGWVGVFFGRLIQAAVSRQREFLADASAVQFTRNPPGLSGALQKIGGLAFGSKLESEHAEEASHMFFGNGMGKSFFNAMATHPPLKERIQAIDPSWDGKYPRVALAEPERAVEQLLKKPRGWGMPPILPLPGAQAAAAGFAPQTARPQTVRPQTVLPSLGKPTPMHLRYAEELRNSFPESVKLAARDPLSATALTYALVLSDDETLRANQLKELAQKTSPSVYEKITQLWPEVASVSARTYLPLIELTIPALRHLRLDEFQQFSRACLNSCSKKSSSVTSSRNSARCAAPSSNTTRFVRSYRIAECCFRRWRRSAATRTLKSRDRFARARRICVRRTETFRCCRAISARWNRLTPRSIVSRSQCLKSKRI